MLSSVLEVESMNILDLLVCLWKNKQTLQKMMNNKLWRDLKSFAKNSREHIISIIIQTKWELMILKLKDILWSSIATSLTLKKKADFSDLELEDKALFITK